MDRIYEIFILDADPLPYVQNSAIVENRKLVLTDPFVRRSHCDFSAFLVFMLCLFHLDSFLRLKLCQKGIVLLARQEAVHGSYSRQRDKDGVVEMKKKW